MLYILLYVCVLYGLRVVRIAVGMLPRMHRAVLGRTMVPGCLNTTIS